jgi:hypothetical protein
MKTATKFELAKEILAREIEQAKKHDHTGDVTLRNQIVSRLLNDEMGLPESYIRKALRNAGLIR